ncbi:diacylglycerol kinase : Probable diacylglycerol kinase OS=Blastopirellula marina DSM 3645 GN=DSM3645_13805 PE=4 SV=1: DAGK_prokar [Gemmata massiliana]|uniref:Diacylglycerol kinase n=1 Tax=Gemmata massiliana TaxID=1210884 RepID=A0A6P2CY28_9BACT|nr:diacylglycerol kinase [Gemmata massiliana]VTR93015.1 diacylglycerol kinase : Probable diacylglycerol kinase OS=Blastopirellula marina DSM 3645 GN=DSM3645_13805 PE=4 SV=1: DAGK_prokar [Gemmata massiliana]
MSANVWSAPNDDEPTRKKPRLWRDKFREAVRGVKRGVRGHSSFSVHFFCAVVAVAAAVALECDYREWCLVIGCIGLVVTAELFNSSIETLFRGLDQEARDRVYGCLDIAAGAVLVAGLCAATVGAVIFGRKILLLFHWLPA